MVLGISKSLSRESVRAALFGSVSVAALLMVAPGAYARPLGGSQTPTPSAAAIAAAQSGQLEAARAARAASNLLRRATLAIQAQQASQQAARDAARAALNASQVPNGLGVGGLLVAPQTNPANLWQGANLPTQFTDGDRVKVNIEQTKQKAILTWDTFHVGGKTDLTFQQGASNWVALNRVLGTDNKPSQILGSINAKGQVYVINQNGIIFGGASQVNVGALIASTAKIDLPKFLDSGIYSSGSGSNWTPSFTDAAALLGLTPDGGKVKIEAGAQIATHAPDSVTSGGGFVLLMGGRVENAGAIMTPLGQTQLAAGDDFVLRRGYGTDQNLASTTRGNEIAPVLRAGSLAGLVRNDGIIFSPQGDITLAGRTIEQNGILVASTSVNTRGTIHLLNSATDTRGSVTLGANSLTTVIPELESKETALNSQRDALIKRSDTASGERGQLATGAFNNLSLLADRLDQSRIEIITGGNVVFKGGASPDAGSLTIAQGGQVAVSAGGRIFTESGATIDVSGVRDVALAMSENNILVNIQGNELRDSPQNRDNGYLKNQDVWVDIRDLIYVPKGTGGYDSDRYYTPGGLLEVGGYLANTKHTIGEWSAVGGTITLAAPEVIAQAGSVFDISGGSVSYAGGYIRTSNFLGRDGKLYNIGDARGDMTFYGLGEGFVRESARWGVTEVWTNPFGRGRETLRWEDGYTVGRDAGRLNLSTPTAIFEGNILADVIRGERQFSARPSGITDGYMAGQNSVAQAGTLALGQYTAAGLTNAYTTDVKFTDIAAITAGLTAADALPGERANTAYFDAEHLSAQGLGGLSIATRGGITVDSDLTLAYGGQVRFVAPMVDIKADITARSGSVSVSNIFKTDVVSASPIVLTAGGLAQLTLHSGATIDVRGLWINALTNPNDLSGQAFVNGGNVTFDSTHNVTIAAGSTIDATSGAAILPNAKTKGGRGGNVTLIADNASMGSASNGGTLVLDGDIKAYGVNGGGKLTIESGPAIVIGGKALDNNGRLGAGEKAPANLTATEAFVVRAGEVLPADYLYTKTLALPGDALGGLPNFSASAPVVLAQAWTPPAPRSTSYTLVVDGAPRTIYAAARPTFPAGARITELIGATEFPSTYVVPGNVFPSGIPIVPTLATLAAGNIAPVDVTFAAGTQIVAGSRLSQSVAVKPLLNIATGLLQTGFSNYEVNGHQGLVVVPGAALDVAMPVYRFTNASYSAPSDGDPAASLELWTPPLFLENPVKAELTQRRGAGVTLKSDYSKLAGGPIIIGTGSRITVDPGQSIKLQGAAGSQITVDGALNAPGGVIDIDIVRARPDRGSGVASARSIWIGDHATLDVAARATVATDGRGRRYGVVADGGTIRIGGGLDWEDAGLAVAADAFVVIRPGAVLDASGTSAVLDLPGSGRDPYRATTVASNGGSIILKSNNGLYLDGTFNARAGGAGAAGGTLALALETPNYVLDTGVADAIRKPREFVLAQSQGGGRLAPALQPGEADPVLVYGSARLGVDKIAAGGFDNLSVLVNGLLSFDGDTSLRMGQSMRLYAGAFGLSENAAANTQVDLASAYLRMAGTTRAALDYHIMPTVTVSSNGTSQQSDSAYLSVTGDMVDIRDLVGFGARAIIEQADGSKPIVDRRGFATIDLASSGDLRFLKGEGGSGRAGGIFTEFAAPGDLTITAGQIYPATAVTAQIVAGNVLTVRKAEGPAPDAPWSVFGKLYLDAPVINQGGVIRAPGGALEIGRTGNTTTLLPGSITSVSMAGLLMPYGGTIDGLTYKYDGRDVTFTGLATDDIQARPINGISVGGARIAVEAGAVLDLSGGGDILGAGFVSGRGGSIDVLRYALADANPGFGYSASGNKVYAIVPSFKGSYAPVVPDAANPAIGQQITVPAGVPGLAAGTYTLLPATYALLPGAFRIEVGSSNTSLIPTVAAIGNGSYVATGQMGVANTGIAGQLPTQLILTPGKSVRTHSNYNETSYATIGIARAQELGWARPRTAADAGNLTFLFNLDDANPGSALRFDGQVLQAGAKGGFAGQVSVRGLDDGAKIEIMAPGAVHQAGYISIAADELNGIGASRLVIGGSLASGPGPVITVQSRGGELVVRSGAVLSAGDVLLVSGYYQQDIVVEAGASINTIGKGAAPFDSSAGYLFDPRAASVVAVSNGWLEFLPPQSNIDSVFGGGNVRIGACAGSVCSGETGLYSAGTIAFSSQQTISLADSVRYGTKNLVLGVSTVNIGSEASLADAAGRNVLAPGLSFNQDILERLLAGNSGAGIPKLESLVLTARQSVNFYGTVDLNTIDPATGQSSLKQLVLSTPAIYGYGNAGDVATLTTGSLVWTGVSSGDYGSGSRPSSVPPAAVIPGGAGTGHGTLNIVADSIELGYADRVRADNQVTVDRLILGFGTANLNASKRIGGNAKGTLSVYEAQGAYVASKGYSYTGGNLNLTTPLLTGGAGSVTSITAGGTLNVIAPQGADLAKANSDALGATLNLKGETINVASAVVLPSGKLSLSATGDIALTGNARIDMSGRAIKMFDTTQYSWGGDVAIESARGNVRQAAGSVIDLSAENNQAGKLTVVALDANAGHVDLAGTIRGTASGRYDAGAGVYLGYLSGRVEVRGQTIADFTGLNQRLGAGGFFGERSFQLKQGNLVVGDELKANTINLSVDGGSLTVNGRIDASGERVGAIRLSARDGLMLGSGAVLDARGTVLRVDSGGKAIDAPNRAIVELTSSHGTIALQSGATIDLRSADNVARGTLTLNASRRGGAGIPVGERGIDGANDIAIDAAGPLTIRGARSIVVNGFRRYTDAPLAAEEDVNGRFSQVITQDYLDDIHDDSAAFVTAAKGNGALMARLSGLSRYQDAFHLRPGVEIAGDTADRDLRIGGDLDLSGYRYDSINPNFARTGIYGSGEPGSLIIRGGSDLNIYGSINDGFRPVDTPDGNGWVLKSGVEDYASPTILPTAVTLKGAATGTTTTISNASSLNYDIPIHATTVALGMVIPIDVTTSAAFILPAGTVLRAAATLPDGTVLAAGTIVSVATTLPSGTRLAAGTLLPGASTSWIGVAAMTVPAGTPLDVFGALSLSANVTLKAGAFIPSNSRLEFVSGSEVDLRPTGPDGKQGKSYVVAPMLAPGSLSWNIGLVAGGDLGAADSRMLRTRDALDGRGNMTLSDRHYMPDITFGTYRPPMITSVIRTGTGDLSLLAGGDYNQSSLYGIYTAGTQSAPILDENGANPYNLPRGKWSADLDWSGVSPVLGPYFGSYSPDYEALVTGDNYQAWYPELGGNLLVAAQRNLVGVIQNGTNPAGYYPSSNLSSLVGNWLWRQGGEEGGQKTAWWINFGTYASPYYTMSYDFIPQMPAFSGFGALGGGNVAVRVGGDAGVQSGLGKSTVQSSQGLNIAIGSTGRVLADGSIVRTGGGDISVDVGGAVNPLHPRWNPSGKSGLQNDLNGALVNLRGAVDVRAGSIGRIDLTYGATDALDPRAPDAFAPNKGTASGGMVLVLGDAATRFAARGDLVLGGVVDAGLGVQVMSTPYTKDGVSYDGGGYSAFPLWTSATALDLFSAGGNLTPLARRTAKGNAFSNDQGDGLPLPARMHVVAASGSIYLDGIVDLVPRGGGYLVPSKTVQVEFLAGQSIYGEGASFHPSAANPDDMISPQKPYFYAGWMLEAEFGTYNPGAALDGMIGNLPGSDRDPLRFYAVNGDLIGLTTGEFKPATGIYPNRYTAAKPVWMQAGRDIVNAGGLFLHDNTGDVSIVSAGRDIIYANVQVAGPGQLDVAAGRNIYQADKGSIVSIGPVVPGDTRPGASILMQAGMGAKGPNYAELAKLYLDPANLAVTGVPLAEQKGKVAKTYEKELATWLKARFGFTGSTDEARAYFATLAPEQQRIFLRTVYFAELREGGREYNDQKSSRFGSYLRGRNVIAALFPEKDENGNPITYVGDITMFGGSGVRTQFGGDIQMLTPGGRTVIGVEGLVPPSTSGVVTQGSGNIQMYSKGSILLGLSRIMTTFGGNILAWSAEGDINAGRGAKTTVLFTPPKRVYDNYGNVALSPQAPSAGAGIATLNPIPEVKPGDIDLIAPEGTIDAGEAGIRFSGNANIAALQIVNAANIKGQGTMTGIPQIQAPNIGGLTQASNTAGAASQQASTPKRDGAAQQPSVIIVEVIGYGGGDDRDEQKRRGSSKQSQYNPNSAFQLIGDGDLSAEQLSKLTPEERKQVAN